jgi:hypothetical protein
MSILYPSHADPVLSEKLFRRPTAAYRGTPFWAWNCRLDRDQLLRQIGQFQEMGYGGFHMHARTGLDTEYLGKEFLALIEACTSDAKQRGMLAWLYDEDRWPSGFGGGHVTRDPKHRMKYLLFTSTPYNGTTRPTPNWSNARTGRMENGELLAAYSVRVTSEGLVDYRRIAPEAVVPADAVKWYAYLESAGPVPWYNNQTYVDTLSPEALKRFTEVTHERFKAVVGSHFGGTIPAIFTDEPQHAFKETFDYSAQGTDVTIPATTDFFATYQKTYGEDLLEALPELFWELPRGEASVARYRYHDHVTVRFAGAFARTLGEWCERNGLLLTGHMMEEKTLLSQTRAVGDVMRSLAHFQLPGIDMLCDYMELTTAKQAQSVAHQYARPGVMSELYGVTGWSFDFIGHKAHGDWQAALGVTVRVPHLSWVSMAGEAKRDYPASIHYQSPWWREYRLIEDHFARLNVVLTRGRPLVRVAVVHPLESYWLCYGPLAETKDERERRDRQFAELPEWLVGNLLDFNFVSEGLLHEQDGVDPGKGFTVGAMTYDAVLVPSLRTIRATTLKRLERFADAGGLVIFAGDVPDLVDAAPSPRAAALAHRCVTCAWGEREIIANLQPARELDVRDVAGIRYRELAYQLRVDHSERHLFICNRNRTRNPGPLIATVRGQWRVFSRDTIDGSITEIHAESGENETRIPLSIEAHGHALLTLRRGASSVKRKPSRAWKDIKEVQDPVRVTLSEPNVLLLDQPEWRIDGGKWQPRDETLRVHNFIRNAYGLPDREGHIAQPWTDPVAPEKLGRIELRFRIESEVPVRGARLAVEDTEEWTITVDGKNVRAKRDGWFVDEAIGCVRLPALTAGRHEIVLGRDFTRRTELEWCYLLGDFGVRLAGRHAVLTAPVRKLAFGDWTRQGLPFYAGNVTYHLQATVPARNGAVRFPRFQAPLLTVEPRGGKPSPVAFAPFRYEFAAGGDVRFDVTAFGNRHNAFGPLHNIDPKLVWIGPNAWRTEGDNWAYEYLLKPMGILVAPRIQESTLAQDVDDSRAAVVGESEWAPRKIIVRRK